jgi:ethanolamine transporter EutH
VPADGCEPIWSNSEAVKGSIVVVDRGTCPFADQAMHAQAMGAAAVVVVDNKPGAAAFAMPGIFSSVSIPATLITQEDGASLKDGLQHGATTLPMATLKIGPCACVKHPSTLHAFRSPRVLMLLGG